MPYSASLDEFFDRSDQSMLAPFSFEDNAVHHDFNARNGNVSSFAPNSFGTGPNSAFAAPELDDCLSLQSGFSDSCIQ